MEGLNSCCFLLLLLFPVLQVPFLTIAREGRKEGKQSEAKQSKGSGVQVWMEALAGLEEVSTQEGVEVSGQWQTLCSGWTGSTQPEHEVEAASANCICLEGCSRFWVLYMSTDTSSPFLLYLSCTYTPHSLTPEHLHCFSTDTWAALVYQCSDL